MAFVGKFAVAATFSVLYVYSAELYPTCVRASAVGICSSGKFNYESFKPFILYTLRFFEETILQDNYR